MVLLGFATGCVVGIKRTVGVGEYVGVAKTVCGVIVAYRCFSWRLKEVYLVAVEGVKKERKIAARGIPIEEKTDIQDRYYNQQMLTRQVFYTRYC